MGKDANDAGVPSEDALWLAPEGTLEALWLRYQRDFGLKLVAITGQRACTLNAFIVMLSTQTVH